MKGEKSSWVAIGSLTGSGGTAVCVCVCVCVCACAHARASECTSERGGRVCINECVWCACMQGMSEYEVYIHCIDEYVCGVCAC